MADENRCTRCGALRPADAVGEVCPGCRGTAEASTQPDDTQTYVYAREVASKSDSTNVVAALLRASDAGKRYTSAVEFSRGGMGRVYIVHDEVLRREVALKELLTHPPPVGDDGATVTFDGENGERFARFMREARITGRLEHPAIVPVYELGARPDGTPYYTMRQVRGKTLEDALSGCTTLAERLRLLRNFVDLCMGVAYAHSKHVVHRDIKTSNVMVGEFGETVIIDWGLAKVMSGDGTDTESEEDSVAPLRQITRESPAETRVGSHLGTPAYMSPEQAAGDPQNVDERSDVFSLGVVLYKILTGHLPFVGTTAEATLERVREAKPVPPGVREPHLPRELASICEKALARRKSDRYQSAQDLARDIENFLTGSVVSTYTYSAREKLQRFYRRYRTAVKVAAPALLLLVTIGAYSYFNVRQARDEALFAWDNEADARDAEAVARAEAEQQTYLAQIRLAQAHVNSRQYRLAEDALKRVDPAQHNWEWGYLLNRSRQALHTFEGFSLGVLSGDGKYVAAAARDKPLTVFDAATYEAVRSFPGTEFQIMHAVFAGDGQTLLAGTVSSDVIAWDLETGAERARFDSRRGGVKRLSLHPDEPIVAWTATDNAVRLWDWEADATIQVIRTGRNGLSQVVFGSAPGLLVGWFLDDPNDVPEVRAWDWRDGRELWRQAGNRPDVFPDRARLAMGEGIDAVLRDAMTGEEIRRYSGHDAKVQRVRAGPSGEVFASGSADGAVALWHVDEQDPRFVADHTEGVWDLLFSADGSLLLSTSLQGLIRVWNTGTGTLVNELAGHEYGMNQAYMGADTGYLLTAARDGSTRLWDPTRVAGQRQIKWAETAITSLALSPNQNRLLSLAINGRGTVYDVSTWQPTAFFAAENLVKVVGAAWLGDGRRILLNLDGRTPFVFDNRNHSIQPFTDHEGAIGSLAATGDGQWAISAGWAGNVRIWSTSDGLEAYNERVSEEEITDIAVASDAQHFAAGARDGTVSVFGFANGDLIARTKATNRYPRRILFTDADRRLVIGCNDGQLLSWEWQTPDTQPIECAASSAAITGLAAGNDRLIVAGENAALRVMELGTFQEIIDLDRPGRKQLSAEVVSWMDIGGRVVAGLENGELLVWESTGSDEPNQARRAQKPSDSPTELYFFVSATRIQKQAETFLRTRGNQSLEGEVPSGDAAGLFARLGSHPEDVILGMHTPGNLSDEPVSAIELLASQSIDELDMQVRRGDHLVEWTVILIEVASESSSVGLSKETALTRLAETVSHIDRSLTRPTETFSSDSKNEWDGLALISDDTVVLRSAYEGTGLFPGDVIRSVDREPLVSLPQARAVLSDVMEKVRDDRDQVVFEIYRGAFRDCEIVWELGDDTSEDEKK